MRRSLLSRGLGWVFRGVNRVVPWHRLPPRIAVVNLWLLREQLRQYNLHDTSGLDRTNGDPPPPFTPRDAHARTPDGSHNDLGDPRMGMTRSRLGRNVPLEHTYPEEPPGLLEPSPREISRRLMTRTEFVPASTLNLLAAAWIQFQVHGWFSHQINHDDDEAIEIPLKPGDDWHTDPMRVHRTAADSTRGPGAEHHPPTFLNQVSQWWDASAIYGSSLEEMQAVRSYRRGRLRVENGRLPINPASGIAITGFDDNWWLGLSLLHTLFTLEHNAICDHLRRHYPGWSDEQLFNKARLINAALMAKIHTVEWTPAILGHPALQIGMNGNWWGLATERITRLFGRLTSSEVISGIPGSPADHHGAPYALTEEFVSVYRMHPLIPDEIAFRSIETGEHLKTADFGEVNGRRAREVLDAGDASMLDVLYSFGIAHPGAIELHNYPRFLQDLMSQDGRRIDLAAVDVLRDRERGVPRYNAFRKLVHCRPARSFNALTSNPEWAEQLRQIYGHVDRVDLMVGMFAEDRPMGFGFSDTAFRIFILMASRRLKSDRFFTTDYTPRVYSQQGIDWIHENDMTTVLLRHYPELAPALHRVDNAFAPWRDVRTLSDGLAS